MTDTPAERTDRVIDLSIEVDGSPEEVWRAIATGPGISSWYVPHTIVEREGGATTSSFGPGPEMQIPGIVAVWEPPSRVVFTGEEVGATLAFEWLVEARDGGSCVVRLVNTGFGDGDDWDAQFDGMREGWQLFLLNLQLHLRHFRGDSGASMLPMSQWSGGRAAAWAHLLAGLGFGATPAEGDRVSTTGTDAPPLGGTVLQASDWRLALLLDDPAPGTAFLAVEGTGDQVGVSVWSYVYGTERDSIVERDLPRWNDWLAAHAPGTSTGT